MNNDTPTIPPTVIAPREQVNQTDVHKQVAALIDVHEKAWHLLDHNNNSTDESTLWEALQNPILEGLNKETLMATIDACVNMALPGSPLYAKGVGIVDLTYPDGHKSMAIALDLYPGKQVIFAMNRETAENFEKILAAAITERFGRIIHP